MLRTGEQQDANQALLDCVVISGSAGKSARQQGWRSTNICCCTNDPLVCLWILDCLPEVYKAVESLPYNLPSPAIKIWHDKVTDTDVLSPASQPSIYILLMRAQICWASHIFRMPDEWWAHTKANVLRWALLTIRWRSEKALQDTVTTSLKSFSPSALISQHGNSF